MINLKLSAGFIKSAGLLTAFAALPIFSLSAQTVYVYQKNGERVKYNVEDVDRIEFRPAVEADETNLLSEKYVPCEGFREWIDTNLGDGSGYYSLEQAAAYTGTIDLSRNEQVTDITGIEYFTGLTSLIGEDAYFGNFDLSALKSLEYLKLVNTKITELDFTGLDLLKKAFVNRNKLTTLNLAGHTSLESLWCDTNELTELDITGCTNLVELVCSFNNLSSLTLPDCPLEILSIHKNQALAEVDLSKVIGTLKHLSNSDCSFTSLDLSGATKLTYFDCSQNPLASAPILSGCSRLEEFRMENIAADMSSISFADCTRLNMLRMDFSNIGSKIDLTKNKKLYELSLQGCGLEEINLSGLINLGYVNVSDNRFSRLDVASADGLYSFFANRNAVKAQVKVWSDFNIADPEAAGFYIDSNITLVYEFSE